MSGLSRFGVAMESSLLAQFDQLVRERGATRSELFRDLARAEIVRSLSRKRVDAFASVTIVYNQCSRARSRSWPSPARRSTLHPRHTLTATPIAAARHELREPAPSSDAY
jgi:hypothetical protein